MRFISNHHQRTQRRANNPNWKGGRVNTNGYVYVRHGDWYKLEHVVIAEKALGRPLSEEAEVHHANEKRGDNRNQNLVICQDHDFHTLLHRRMRAFHATGCASAMKCRFCKTYGLPGDDDTHTYPNGKIFYHKPCSRAYEKARSK